MRIGIDARFYGSAAKGLGRYTSELITHLETIVDDHDYVVFLRAENFEAYVPKSSRFTKALADFPWYGWREQLLFPRVLRRHRIDLMHFTHFNLPLLYRRPFVVTVHDLILLSHPTTRATTLGPLLFWLKYQAYKLVIGRAIARARIILAVSETTRQDILARFPNTPPDRVVTTLLACSPALRAGTPAQLRSDLQSPFAIYVGNAYPHKNLERLLDGFAEFRQRGHQDWHLVLVGAEDYFYARLKREGEASGRNAGVTFFGQATDAELASLYDAASFYVFPSLYEGFGLPPLEAMCRDLPVASSNASCMPEVLGDAARYFDPKDIKSMADAMADLADNAALCADLIVKGRRNAARFDWNRTAAITHDTYLAALGASH